MFNIYIYIYIYNYICIYNIYWYIYIYIYIYIFFYIYVYIYIYYNESPLTLLDTWCYKTFQSEKCTNKLNFNILCKNLTVKWSEGRIISCSLNCKWSSRYVFWIIMKNPLCCLHLWLTSLAWLKKFWKQSPI